MGSSRSFFTGIVEAGFSPGDDQQLRLKKIALTMVPLIIGPAAFIWGSIYFLLGHPLSGAIPMSYSIISAVSLVYFFRTKRMTFLQHSQMILVLLLPFLLMWSLGGFAAGSMVMLWAIFTPVAALMFFDKRTALLWFLAYFALIVVSVLFDSTLAAQVHPLPAQARDIFYLLNMGSASAGLFLLVSKAVGEERRAIEQLRGEQVQLKEAQLELRGQKGKADDLNRMLHTVLDTIPVRIFWKDRNLCYLGCNQLFASDAGKASPREVVGQDDYKMDWGNSAALYRSDDWEVMESGQARYKYEEPQRHRNGSTSWRRTTKVPLRDTGGKVFGVLGMYEDITREKEIEQELIHSKQAAEAASVAKSAFLANMSHEIRTPMNAIMGMTYLLQQNATDATQKAQLDKVNRSAKHLLGLINDILDYSKIEADNLQLDEAGLNIKALLDHLMSMMGDRVREKGLVLIEEVAPELETLSLLGDSLRITQVLVNYVGNAIKFTEHGQITVRASVTDSKDEHVTVHFEVQDTGIGIPEESQARLFNSFEQLETSTTRKYGGTGLGLAISKRLAGLMGGEVGLTSTPGRGSTFWFTVVLRKGTEELLEADAAPSRHTTISAGSHVLLVEDNAVNQMVAVDMLEMVGLRVAVANHGGEAVAQVQTESFDLILMDMQMPVMDGLEATRQIRALGVVTPIVAMTANAFHEDREKCRLAGMNDFVTKPVDPERLFAILARWIPQ